jgi:hypothetical protein
MSGGTVTSVDDAVVLAAVQDAVLGPEWPS